MIQHFGWTYISTIFSRNTYGRFGIDSLVRIAGEIGICIDLNEGIDETATVSDYQKIADKLSRSTANVVVFYSTRQHVQELFKHLENVTTRHFTWIGSSGWTQLANEFPPNIVSGFFGVLPVSIMLIRSIPTIQVSYRGKIYEIRGFPSSTHFSIAPVKIVH